MAGLVDRPQELSLAGLRDGFARHEVVAALQCAGNRRVDLLRVRDIPGELPWAPERSGNARWTGVRLADVLAAAGIRAGAGHVAFLGADVCPEASPPQPFGGSVPLAKALVPRSCWPGP